VENTNITDEIRCKMTAIEEKELLLIALRARVQELENEKSALTVISAKFACFLKSYAISTYNDALADYLEHLINVQRSVVSVGGDSNVLKGLEEMQTRYKAEVELLQKSMMLPNSAVKLPAPNEIKELLTSLFRLEVSGPMLKEAMRIAEASAAEGAKNSEKRVNASRSRKPNRSFCRSATAPTYVSPQPGYQAGAHQNVYHNGASFAQHTTAPYTQYGQQAYYPPQPMQAIQQPYLNQPVQKQSSTGSRFLPWNFWRK
jgi:hypothetical protein